MKLTTSLFALSLIFAPLVGASTISLTLTDLYPTSASQGTYTGDDYTGVNAGVMTFEHDAFGDFLAFCVEPTQTISLNETITYNVEALGSVELAQVFAAFLASPRDTLNAQGAQWAIWELVRDDKENLKSGLVKLPNGAVRDSAQHYLDTYLDFAPVEGAVLLTSPNRQDMIAVIPEPSSAAVFGAFGLLGLLIRRRN